MENCDISTAGSIKKRAGYVTWGGKLPILCNGTARTPNNYMHYRVEDIDLTTVQNVYNWTCTKAQLLSEYSIDPTEFDSPSLFACGNFFSIKVADSDPAPTLNRLFPIDKDFTTYGIAPIKVIGRYAIFSKAQWMQFWGAYFFPAYSGGSGETQWTAFCASSATITDTTTATPAAVGYVFPYLDPEKITRLEWNTTDDVQPFLRVHTVNPLPIGAVVRLQGITDNGVLTYVKRSDGTSRFDVYGVDASAYVAYTRDIFIQYSLVDAVDHGLTWDASIPDITVFMDAIGYDNYPVKHSGWYYGSGASAGDIQSVEAYFNTSVGKEELSCVVNGAIFKLKDYEIPTHLDSGKTYPLSAVAQIPPAIAGTQTLTKTNGVYSLTFSNAYQYYIVGDKIAYSAYAQDGSVKSSYSFEVVSATQTTLDLSTDDTSDSIVFTAGYILHYTRTAKFLTLSTVPYSGSRTTGLYGRTLPGDTIFLGGFGDSYPAHEMLWENAIQTNYDGQIPSVPQYSKYGILFKNEVTYSSGMVVYVGSRWEEVTPDAELYRGATAGITPTYQITATPYSSELVSSASFSAGTWFASKVDGVFRSNGEMIHSLKLIRPQIESVRSIPGSVGTFPISEDTNGERIGSKVSAWFVFSFLDNNNNLVESEASSADTALGDVFYPNAAVNGEEKAELIEYRISPPNSLSQIPSNLKLDVYVTAIETTSGAYQECIFYRSVPVVAGVPVTVIVGDLSISSVASAPEVKRLYALTTNRSNLPCLHGKYLTVADNRLVLLNCRTYEHIKFRTLKNFRDADNNFGAYIDFKFPSRSSASMSSITFTTDPYNDLCYGSILPTYSGKVGRITAGSYPSPLQPNTLYWIIYYPGEYTYFRLATSAENAKNGVYIDIQGAGSGTISIAYDDTPQGFFTAPLGVKKVEYPYTYLVTGIASDTITLGAAPSLVTGNSFTFDSDYNIPTGAKSNTTYYAIHVGLNQYKIATSAANAVSGTFVSISAPGGSVYVKLDGFFAPANQLELTGYPGGVYPRYWVALLDYTSTYTSARTSKQDFGDAYDYLTLSYTDRSRYFSVSGTAGVAGNKVRLRAIGKDVSGQSIDFPHATFKVNSYANNLVLLESPTQWRDSNLSTSGVPVTLDKVPFAYFLGTTDVLTPSAGSSYISISGNSTSTEIYLMSSTVLTIVENDVIVISGPSSLGNLKASDSGNRLLYFESDLIFKVGAVTPDTFGYKYPLNPVTLSLASGSITTSNLKVSSQDTVGLSSANYPIEIHKLESTTARQATGFSIAPATLTVSLAKTTTSVLSSTSVGDYVTFVLSQTDQSLLPEGYPDVSQGAFKVLAVDTSGASNILTLKITPKIGATLSTAAVEVKFTATSYLVNLNKLIKPTADGFELPITLRGGVNYQPIVLPNYKAFLLLRGIEYSTANFQLSGWYTTGTGGSYGELNYTKFVTGTPPTIDYSRISGIGYSACLLSVGVRRYPIPVPVSLGAAATCVDLALPLFSKSDLLTDVGLVQVGKRITSCINSTELATFTYGVFGSMWRSGESSYLLPCAPDEIIIFLMNRDSEKYRVEPYLTHESTGDLEVSTTSTDSGSYFEVTKYNPSTSSIENKTLSGAFVEKCSFYASDLPNVIAWTEGVSNVGISSSVPQFQEANFAYLISEDDSEITGGQVFQNALIVSKKNSLWRLTFDDAGNCSVTRIQSTVGSHSHNNMPTTLSYMYFIHPTGVFYLDSGGTVDPVFKVNNLFQERVTKSYDYLSRTAGYVDHLYKQMYLGTPYRSNYIENVADVDSQFNYSFNDGVLGWQVNVGIDAYKWTTKQEGFFFASSRGRVFKIRTEQQLSRYRDGEDAIGLAVSTRFLNTGSLTRFKFLRNVLFQFGGTSDFQFNSYYSVDYSPTQIPMETYPVTGSTSEAGGKWYGNGKLLRSLRETLAKRVQSMSFTLTEGSIDTDCPIYTVAVEGFETNTRLVRQKSTPGDRT